MERTDRPGRSSRGTATRQVLLAAALRVFRDTGFTRAGVGEVASAAGTSVGGLYHHFTGKAEIFHTLWEEFDRRQQERTRQAVALARSAGEHGPAPLMTIAARAYLDGCFEERETARLFFGADGPPGFDAALRTRLRAWTDRNAALFRKAEEPVDEALVMVVSGTMILVVAEIVRREETEDARRLADEVTALLSRVAYPRTAPGTPD